VGQGPAARLKAQIAATCGLSTGAEFLEPPRRARRARFRVRPDSGILGWPGPELRSRLDGCCVGAGLSSPLRSL